jgi:hypothetical protein
MTANSSRDLKVEWRGDVHNTYLYGGNCTGEEFQAKRTGGKRTCGLTIAETRSC